MVNRAVRFEKGIRCETGTVPAAVNSLNVPESVAIVRKDEKARDLE